MQVAAIYENGVFRPLEKVQLSEQNEVVLHFWPKKSYDKALANDYAIADEVQSDLEDWELIDGEGWK
ncbi:MAG: antitoxin family protein [Bacteroidia bacterium]|nr:antitoxin family protein [Bacteroidia bacterium]